MGARILIIEDDPASQELASYLLQAAGHRTRTAGDGAAGLAAAHSEQLDLLICDLQIPIVDGFGVVHALKSDATWPRVPIVAMTALSMPGDREKTLAAGFDGYLSKPITPETFVRDIEAFLPARLRSGAS